MKTLDNPVDAFAASQGDNLRKFSDELLIKFKGKMLEIYIGDQYETINYDDYSVPQNCIIYGKLIDVLDRMIIVDCFYVGADKEVHHNNRIYLNQFQIRAMTELNGNGSLNDIFLSAKDADKVRKYALSGK